MKAKKQTCSQRIPWFFVFCLCATMLSAPAQADLMEIEGLIETGINRALVDYGFGPPELLPDAIVVEGVFDAAYLFSNDTLSLYTEFVDLDLWGAEEIFSGSSSGSGPWWTSDLDPATPDGMVREGNRSRPSLRKVVGSDSWDFQFSQPYTPVYSGYLVADDQGILGLHDWGRLISVSSAPGDLASSPEDLPYCFGRRGWIQRNGVLAISSFEEHRPFTHSSSSGDHGGPGTGTLFLGTYGIGYGGLRRPAGAEIILSFLARA